MSEDGPNGNPDPPNQFEEGNTAHLKHGLWQEQDKLVDSLDSEEQKLVGTMSKEFVSKYKDAHGEAPGSVEREMIRNLILDTIKRRRFNDWQFTQEDFINFDSEARHNVYSRLRRDNREEMESLGLLDSPEAKKQEAEADWFEAMSNADPDE